MQEFLRAHVAEQQAIVQGRGQIGRRPPFSIFLQSENLAITQHIGAAERLRQACQGGRRQGVDSIRHARHLLGGGRAESRAAREQPGRENGP